MTHPFAPSNILERARLDDSHAEARRNMETMALLQRSILEALRAGQSSVDIHLDMLGPWPDLRLRQLAEDGYTATKRFSCWRGNYVHIKFPVS